MARRIAQFISIALIAMAAGCSTAPSRFYSLSSTSTADGAPPTPATVMVGPVTIPAAVDQPEFVVQVSANRVDVDEFNRWVAPLGDGIARAVAGDLVVLLGTPQVATQQLANFIPGLQGHNRRATIRVDSGQRGSPSGGVDGAQDFERRDALRPHRCARAGAGTRLRRARSSAQPGDRESQR